MKAHEENWKHDGDGNAWNDDSISDLVHIPTEGHAQTAEQLRERGALIAAAPDMARALLATGNMSDGEWHDGACSYFATGRCYAACETSRAALKKAGVI